MGNSKKVMLIGWDAADWKVINQLIDEGHMPAVKKLVENGVSGNLQTLFPPLSPMLWTSIASGKRPYKHGIYGFTEPAADGKSVQPMSNVSRKCKAIWNILSQQDLESLVVGWWPSHPAEPIKGAMVSDLFGKAPKKPGDPWGLLPRSIHPASLSRELDEMRVHPVEITAEHILPFVPKGAEIDQEHDPRLGMLMRTIAECTTIHATATHLLETQSWDFAAVYYADIDHFSHGFMKYHPPKQDHIPERDFELYQHVIRTAYMYHDQILARLLEFAGEDTTIILMSDHGFHPDHLRPSVLPTEPAGPAAEHRDYGIFIAHGPGIKKDHLLHGANLLDITPTLLTLFDLPVAEDMDGNVLTDIFEREPEVQEIPSWEEVEGDDGRHPKGFRVDPSESKAALDQLVALGYIDKPDDNSEIAISNCVRELDYNLARSYMDGGMHGEAAPLLEKLYVNNPLEFRFGIQLANCLIATDRQSDLKRLVDDLNSRWRVASSEARKRVKEIVGTGRDRKKQWLELKEIDDQNKDDPSNPPKLAKVGKNGKPVLYSDPELKVIRRLRAISRGNPQTLDFLNATLCIKDEDFASALEYLEKSELTKSRNPAFQNQVGNVYLGLDRTDDALRAYQKAVEIDECYSDGFLGICRVFLKKREPQKAIGFARRALGLKYHYPVAHYYLGDAFRRTGNTDDAIMSLKKAIEQNPNFQQAHELLSKIYSGSSEQGLANQHSKEVDELAQQNIAMANPEDPIELPKLDINSIVEAMPDLPNEKSTDQFLPCLAQTKKSHQESEVDSKGDEKEIIIVSGLPRSGTSLMMQMLSAGGLEAFTDKVRSPDESNPKGYFEVEAAKQLAHNNIWLEKCPGKVVKVVAPLLPYLPQKFNYRIVFVNRDIAEIVESQNKMLERLELPGGQIEPKRLADVFLRQAAFAKKLLRLYKIPVLQLDFRDVIASPGLAAEKMCEFIGTELESEVMASQIDSSLYRQKKGKKA